MWAKYAGEYDVSTHKGCAKNSTRALDKFVILKKRSLSRSEGLPMKGLCISATNAESARHGKSLQRAENA